MKASAILSPSESKKLISKGVIEHPKVKKALRKHTVIIALGTTNAYVADQIVKEEVSKANFVAGFNDNFNNVTTGEERSSPIVLEKGKKVDKPLSTARKQLKPDDVFIKGGNALDSQRRVGVMVGAKDGGTVGRNMGYVVSRGTNLIIPIGLEKCISGSVPQISKEIGNQEFDKSTGIPAGLWPLNGTVVTEIEALDLLTGVEAYQIGAGGVGEGRGSVTLGLIGSEEEVNNAFGLIEEVKGEAPLKPKGQYPK